MDTENTESVWEVAMNVTSVMKKEGLDTGDAVRRLRDAKVLLNHCKYDEHAHGEELFEVEIEIDAIHRDLMSVLEETGKKEDYSFKPPSHTKAVAASVAGPPSGLPKDKSWARIRLPDNVSLEDISQIEGLEVIAEADENITIVGEKPSIKKALDEISKAYSK